MRGLRSRLAASTAVLAHRAIAIFAQRIRTRIHRRNLLKQALKEHHFGIPAAEETVPPEDETFTVHAVCAVEFYTPSHARTLFQRLREMGFDDVGVRWGETASEYARQQRARAAESWKNLGIVVPRGSTWPLLERVETDLPRGVTVGFLSLYALTPSLTALVAIFALDDESAREFDSLARRIDFNPRGYIIKNGFTIDPPANVKRDAMRTARRRNRMLAADWITAHIPGVFAGEPEAMPTADVVTTEKETPFDEASKHLEYLDFADLGYWPPDIWVSSEAPAWRLSPHRDDAALTIAGRHDDVSAALGYWSRDRLGIVQQLNELLFKDLVLWAATHLVAKSQRRLARIRDEGQALSVARRPTRRLKRIGNEFLKDSIESRTVAAELHTYAQDPKRVVRGAAEWSGVESLSNVELLERLRERLLVTTEVCLATEERLRDGLVAEATLVSAVATLRLQVWLLVLTLLTVGIGVAAIIVAVRSRG